MATGRSTTPTLRIDPAVKEALRTATDRKHRSIVNMVEVMIWDYCGLKGITIPDQVALFDDHRKTEKNRK